MKAGGLFLRVIEFAETIAELTACDVELKALGHFRAGVIGAGQGGDFSRVLHDEGGLPELFFDGFFKVQHLQAGQRARREPVFLLSAT